MTRIRQFVNLGFWFLCGWMLITVADATAPPGTPMIGAQLAGVTRLMIAYAAGETIGAINAGIRAVFPYWQIGGMLIFGFFGAWAWRAFPANDQLITSRWTERRVRNEHIDLDE